ATVTYVFPMAISPNANTATAGEDYTATSGTLSWAAGEGGSKSLTIPLLADTAVEKPETFAVALIATGGDSPKISYTSIIIADDDAPSTTPVITLVPGSTSVQESAGYYTLTASLSQPTNHAVSVRYAFDQPPSGTAGSADVSMLPGSLLWGAGQSGPR